MNWTIREVQQTFIIALEPMGASSGLNWVQSCICSPLDKGSPEVGWIPSRLGTGCRLSLVWFKTALVFLHVSVTSLQQGHPGLFIAKARGK